MSERALIRILDFGLHGLAYWVMGGFERTLDGESEKLNIGSQNRYSCCGSNTACSIYSMYHSPAAARAFYYHVLYCPLGFLVEPE